MAHGKRYRAARELVREGYRYNLDEAVGLVKQVASAKFDESVDVAFRLGVDPKQADHMVRGALSLPHGSGKTVRVVVFAEGDAAREALEAGADEVGADELINKINDGWVEFDKAIAVRNSTQPSLILLISSSAPTSSAPASSASLAASPSANTTTRTVLPHGSGKTVRVDFPLPCGNERAPRTM